MLISPVILVRLMPVAAFGQYREYLLYVSLLVAFATFSIYESQLYFIPAWRRFRSQVINQTLLLVACSSALVVTFTIVLDLLLHGMLIGQFLWQMALYVLLYVNVDYFECAWVADQRSMPVFIYTSMRLLARMIVVIAAALLTRDLQVIIWALIGLEAIRLAGAIVAWRRAIDRGEPPAGDGLWREQLRFCVPSGIAVVLSMASRNVGGIAVVKWLGSASLAWYTIGLYGEPIIAAIRSSISTVLLPAMVDRNVGGATQDRDIWKSATVINCMALFPLCVLLVRFAEYLILRVFGGNYAASIPVLQIFSLVIVRECFDLTLPLRALGRTAPLVRSGVIGLVVNICCVVVLVPRMGIVGAVVAMVFAGLCEALYLALQVRQLPQQRSGGLVNWSSVGQVALAAILAATVILPGFWTERLGIGGLLLAGLVYAMVYVLALWLLKLPELILLIGWLQRARGAAHQPVG
jgi:O-antigen/teichoic acid export membrane protein